MALHLSANGCYGVMLYNNRDFPDNVIEDILSKYGKVQELHKGGRNFVFVYFKHYEEARACLDELKDNPDFHAKPARPRETNRLSRMGLMNRTKSVSDIRDKTGNLSTTFSKSMSKINIDCNNSSDKEKTFEKFSDNNNQDRVSTENRSWKNEEREGGYRPRSRSVGRIDIANATRRADLIKKVIESEQSIEGKGEAKSDDSIGGSFDSFMDKVHLLEAQCRKPRPLPRIHTPRTYNRNHMKKTEDTALNDSMDKKQHVLVPVTYFYDRQFSEEKKKSYIVVIGGLPEYLTIEHLCTLCTFYIPVLRIRLVEAKAFGEQMRAYVYVASEQNASLLAKKLDKKLLFYNIIIAFPLTDSLKEFLNKQFS